MKDTKLIPIWVALFAGCIALFGNFYNGKKSIEIENKQFESNLILKSLVPNDSTQSIKNIRFLIKAGFISDDNEKIIRLIKDTIYHIELPKQDSIVLRPKNGFEVQLNSLQLFSGRIIDNDKKPLSNVEIRIFDKISHKINRDKGFSNTKSDSDGLFKVALPKQASIKIAITKIGYKPIYKLYLTDMLKNLHEISMEAN